MTILLLLVAKRESDLIVLEDLKAQKNLRELDALNVAAENAKIKKIKN